MKYATGWAPMSRQLHTPVNFAFVTIRSMRYCLRILKRLGIRIIFISFYGLWTTLKHASHKILWPSKWSSSEDELSFINSGASWWALLIAPKRHYRHVTTNEAERLLIRAPFIKQPPRRLFGLSLRRASATVKQQSLKRAQIPAQL